MRKIAPPVSPVMRPFGDAPPPWWLMTTSSSAHAAQIGSYSDECSCGTGAPGGTPGNRIPPVRPASLAQRISPTASSTSFSMIWAMPARRPGASWQKSTIQRLCAFSPAHRRSILLRRGLRRDEVPRREERRDGVGEQHLGHHAVSLELRDAAAAVEVAVEVGAPQVVERIDVDLRPLVEFIEVPPLEVLAVGRASLRRHGSRTR